MIKNDTQCKTALDNTCTYIYNSESTSSTTGTCASKNANNFTCEDIKRNNQCDNGGDISSLNNICGIYESTCKTLCSKIDDENTCKNDRSNDCFWIIQNESNPLNPNTQCINKVCFNFDNTYYIYFIYFIL
jgi:hypothetical protein